MRSKGFVFFSHLNLGDPAVFEHFPQLLTQWIPANQLIIKLFMSRMAVRKTSELSKAQKCVLRTEVNNPLNAAPKYVFFSLLADLVNELGEGWNHFVVKTYCVISTVYSQ